MAGGLCPLALTWQGRTHASDQPAAGVFEGQGPSNTYLPVRILSTSCFTVGMKPFE
jgi:hypothetical protein